MAKVIEDMYDLLLEEKELLEQLYELSQEKRRAIIKSEAENLNEIIRREHRGVVKINAVEKKRMALIPEIALKLGVPESDITISLIAQYAEKNEQERLLKVQMELRGLVKAQSEFNAENQELIKAHIEYTEAILELMVDSEDPLNNYYGGDGRTAENKKKNTGFFDGQV